MGLMHDIGKIGIPDLILNKSSKLSDDEFMLMRQHTVIGAQLLNYVENLEWTTYSENVNWSVKNGNFNIPKNNCKTNLAYGKYIRYKCGKYEVYFPGKYIGRFDSLENAIYERDKYVKERYN